jgi:hypothetical protein
MARLQETLRKYNTEPAMNIMEISLFQNQIFPTGLGGAKYLDK